MDETTITWQFYHEIALWREQSFRRTDDQEDSGGGFASGGGDGPDVESDLLLVAPEPLVWRFRIWTFEVSGVEFAVGLEVDRRPLTAVMDGEVDHAIHDLSVALAEQFLE